MSETRPQPHHAPEGLQEFLQLFNQGFTSQAKDLSSEFRAYVLLASCYEVMKHEFSGVGLYQDLILPFQLGPWGKAAGFSCLRLAHGKV